MQISARQIAKQLIVAPLLRKIRRVLRRINPPGRSKSLDEEVSFWRDYLVSKGARWPEDYRNRLDPDFPIQDRISSVVDELPGDEIRILDVGAGPLTKLGKKHPSRAIAITPIDILAPEYDRLLAELEIVPLVRTMYGDAENLRSQFGENVFDIVHAVNSLDHTEAPLHALGEMLAVVRPGGSVILSHYENEADWQDYGQLHQWNFTCEDGDFVLRDRRGRATNVTQEFADTAATSCTRERGDPKPSILVRLRKHG